ncbi:MAG: 50S ribosome-binding GTPase, partial [Thermoguttaceae bacterium]|nr:50S ribosome-binding GTPase [Thermoguttaceae bacterium]
WLVELVDTAGLHLAQDEIEIEGIRRARAEIERADLILWLRDASGTNEDAEEIHFPPEKNVLTVWNKADLVAPGTLSALSGSEIAVSALHETGISMLLDRIVRALVPEEPLPGTGMRL